MGVQTVSDKASQRDDVPPADKRRTRRILNVPLLAGTLVALVMLAPAAYAWHAWQVRRTADAYLQQADRLEKDGKWGSAAGYLFLYLRFRPDDIDARIRLAETFDKAAQDSKRAVDLHYLALGAAPGKPAKTLAARLLQLRIRLGELLLERRRYADAETEAKTIIEADQGNAAGGRILALARYGQYRLGSVRARDDAGVSIGELFEKALELDPGNIILSPILAKIYREEPTLLSEEKAGFTDVKRQALADQVMDRMVTANAEVPAAYLARHRLSGSIRVARGRRRLTGSFACGAR